jgi:hypothetical protein
MAFVRVRVNPCVFLAFRSRCLDGLLVSINQKKGSSGKKRRLPWLQERMKEQYQGWKAQLFGDRFLSRSGDFDRFCSAHPSRDHT